MDNSLGRIAGLAAFVLMLTRMGRLLATGEQAPQWQLIMIAAVFLGGVVWWLLGQTIKNRRLGIAIFTILAIALFLRISVPQTLIAGFIPTLATPGEVAHEFAQALDLIRFGVAPVFPTSGLIGILAVVMWVTGALYVWGATSGPTTAMVVPSLALYLQFAVMDRVRAGRGWMGASIAVVALAVAAVALERRNDAGRVRDLDGRPLPRRARGWAITIALLVATGSLFATQGAAGLVPPNGNLPWRLGGGYGPGFGGVAFDRLADLRQRIIKRSNAVLFQATLSDGAPPASEVYWRMESLDDFDGSTWRPTTADADFYTPESAGGDPEHAYRGTTQVISERIQIGLLRSPVLPTAGIARFLQSDSVNVSGFQTTPDGSILYQAQMGEGDQYQVEAVFPDIEADLGALATLPDGTLSPLFANAAEDGLFPAEPGPGGDPVEGPADIERFIELDEDMPPAIGRVARQQTLGATTDFERAWLLEHWFRVSGEFVYSTEVSTGHGVLDLQEWLTEPTSLNYRTGYCEQFAASMAVLGRAAGIPSRVVWGFTPGRVQTQSDGTEVIVVRDNNAHAWVEMWMDGFGWVKFDPTPRGDETQPESVTAGFDPVAYLPPPDPNAPDISRPGFIDDSRIPGQLDDEGNLIDRSGSAFDIASWWWILPALVLLACGIPILKGVRRRRRLRKIEEGDITAVWDEMVDRLADLGQPIPEHQTPLEFANARDRVLVPIARSYSAAIYGGRNGRATKSDLNYFEQWLKLRYEGPERARAAFSLRSLIDREP
ncbi:MAG: transglutaminaseTgpA domain-containing protein [Acidimicrobiia bacterium]